MVDFVGAGCGAKDLITLRGLKLIQQADVIIYAGSLVNPELLEYAKPGCEIHNSAKMTLEEVIAENVVTLDLVNKEYAKIAETDGKVNQGKLLGIVWKCVIDEFIWDILKKYRNPVIDFGRLRDSCLDLVKEMRPELFGGVPLDGSE